MYIAILGWGSLISEPRGLPVAGEWQKDGPMLWIEFSRISKRGARAGCLTLVIDERSDEEIRTFYVISARTDLAQAIADLQAREGTSPDDIGFCEVASGRFAPNAFNRHPKSCERIRAWAQKKAFNAVIWTALPRRFHDVIGIPFSPAAALRYMDGHRLASACDSPTVVSLRLRSRRLSVSASLFRWPNRRPKQK